MGAPSSSKARGPHQNVTSQYGEAAADATGATGRSEAEVDANEAILSEDAEPPPDDTGYLQPITTNLLGINYGPARSYIVDEEEDDENRHEARRNGRTAIL